MTDNDEWLNDDKRIILFFFKKKIIFRKDLLWNIHICNFILYIIFYYLFIHLFIISLKTVKKKNKIFSLKK